MLRKVLKHDLGAVWKLWTIISATLLLLSVIAGLCLRDIMIPDPGPTHYGPMTIMSVLGLVLTILFIVAYAIISYFYIIYRYYQSFFTDEAYLTFTLPVKRSTLYNSKLLSAFIWNTASGAVLLLGISIILLIAPENVDGTGVMLFGAVKSFIDTVKLFFAVSDGWLIAYTVVMLIVSALYGIFSTLLIYACVTFGCIIASKRKLLSTFLVYYVVNMIISFIGYIFTALTELASEALAAIEMSYELSSLLGLFLLIGVGAFFVIVSVITYNFTLSRLETKLNLA